MDHIPTQMALHHSSFEIGHIGQALLRPRDNQDKEGPAESLAALTVNEDEAKRLSPLHRDVDKVIQQLEHIVINCRAHRIAIHTS